MEQKRLYAQFMFHKGCTIETFYFDGEMQPLTYDQVKAYLPNKESKKQKEQLGLDAADQLKTINPSLKSIREVAVNGQRFEVVME
jgi:prenyltransferase beta subunit